MHIVQIAPPFFAIPPTGYGGIERVISDLTEGLVAAGHRVTLCAPGDSRTSAELVPTTPQGIGIDLSEDDKMRWFETTSRRAYDEAVSRGADIVHDHTDFRPGRWVSAAGRSHHTRSGGRRVCPALHPDQPGWRRVGRHQCSPAGVVRCGGGQGYRMSPRSGLPARSSTRLMSRGRRSTLARRRRIRCLPGAQPLGKGPRRGDPGGQRGGPSSQDGPPGDPGGAALLRRVCRAVAERARVGRGACWRSRWRDGGRPDRQGVGDHLPIPWEEPFGLVLAEAAARGTPVVSLRRGSAPELIIDGVTGILCDDEDAMVRALPRAMALDPSACRAHAEAHFARDVITGEYLEVYSSVISGWKRRVTAPARAENVRRPAPAHLLHPTDHPHAQTGTSE